MSAEALRVVEEIQRTLTDSDVVSALEDASDQRVPTLLMASADPELEVVMIGPEYAPAELQYTGLEGFIEAWRDWTRAFATFRIEVEDMIDAGEKVVSLVRQIATMEPGGAEIESQAAAVWTVRDGLLRRVEFHLDRSAALRAAGVET